MTARTVAGVAAAVSLALGSVASAVMCSFDGFAPGRVDPDTWVSAPTAFVEVRWGLDGSLAFNHCVSVRNRFPSAIGQWLPMRRGAERAACDRSGTANVFIINLTTDQAVTGDPYPLSVLLQTGLLPAKPVVETTPWEPRSISPANTEMDSLLPAREPTTVAVLMLAGFIFFIPRR